MKKLICDVCKAEEGYLCLCRVNQEFNEIEKAHRQSEDRIKELEAQMKKDNEFYEHQLEQILDERDVLLEEIKQAEMERDALLEDAEKLVKELNRTHELLPTGPCNDEICQTKKLIAQYQSKHKAKRILSEETKESVDGKPDESERINDTVMFMGQVPKGWHRSEL